MQCRWRIPFEQMAYIGDNLMKDFQAPKQLGMKSIWFKNQDGLYRYKEKFNDRLVKIVTNINEIGDLF